MFEVRESSGAGKAEFYRDLHRQLGSLLAGEQDAVANAANTAALLSMTMPDINWVGFYFLRDGKELVLGPFQGKPACVRIPVGRGVCGTAVERGRSILVEDVHAFPGHIACDAVSRSELVVPVVQSGIILGVLDLDSPKPARFDADDQAGVERLASIYAAASLAPPPSGIAPELASRGAPAGG